MYLTDFEAILTNLLKQHLFSKVHSSKQVPEEFSFNFHFYLFIFYQEYIF